MGVTSPFVIIVPGEDCIQVGYVVEVESEHLTAG